MKAKPNNLSPIFIVASGRSGTLFLSKLIDLSKEIVMRHEAYASTLISYYSRCVFLPTCSKSRCELIGTDKDKKIIEDLTDICVTDVVIHNLIKLRLGESSSHLPILLRSLTKKMPNSTLILSYRDPMKSLTSVLARKKWSGWFGEFDGRCRYALGVRDDCPPESSSFGDRWLLSWCDVWNTIIDSCDPFPKDQIIFLRLESFTIKTARLLFQKCDLEYHDNLLVDRYPYFERHSSYSGDAESHRQLIMEKIGNEISKKVINYVADTKKRIKESNIPVNCCLSENDQDIY